MPLTPPPPPQPLLSTAPAPAPAPLRSLRPPRRAIKLNLILLFSSFIPLLLLLRLRSPEKNETTKMIDRANRGADRWANGHNALLTILAHYNTPHILHILPSCISSFPSISWNLFIVSLYLLRERIPRGNFHLVFGPTFILSRRQIVFRWQGFLLLFKRVKIPPIQTIRL